ncbi:WD40 repeat domain-containing protein [Cellulomonas fimi]|uniref:WD40 repeat, subgroup n=1 Tax=Cellulomonas fimi (strain ATCC 484 / DSM 20113 / JCM 1341 / CCUG 24087 / LMG 16345 / NBRC 15513 / NCIMB 8980 / NCTC 7547 / NRS-133) TaxID=590998 RepID=F4H5L2_CELFA|nr:WD40 repeat domain-containing protein [Cellulomonas fimi]AEE44336.1 hypothetical protein Celf_0190 [Cellulomonas fimi ATCC 484]NNH08139.1 WD40 repeat domain-containing protein [Cellulomonas fimi]VEH26150.1 Uncharacterised protein [Cellulomonas fimi]
MTITESLRLWLRRAPGHLLRRGILGVAPVVVLARVTSDQPGLADTPVAALFVLLVTVGWLVTDLAAVRLWQALVPLAPTAAVVLRGVLVLGGPVGAYLLARAVLPTAVPGDVWPLLVLPVVSAAVHLADLGRVNPPHHFAVRVVPDEEGEPWVAVAGRRVTLTNRAGVARRVATKGSALSLAPVTGFPGSPLLAAGGGGGVVALLRVPRGDVVATQPVGVGPVRHLRSAVVGGRPVVAAAGEKGPVAIWRPPAPVGGGSTDGTVLCDGHVGGVSGLEWFGTSGGDDVLLSVGADHVLRGWDPATGAQVVEHPVPDVRTGLPRALCRVRRDRRHLVAVGADDGAIRLLDPATGELVQRLEVPQDARWLPVLSSGGGAIHALCAITTPDGTYLAAGGDFPGVQLWDLGTGTLHQWVGWNGVLDTKAACGWIRSLAVRDGATGPELLTAGYDERVTILPLSLAAADRAR